MQERKVVIGAAAVTLAVLGVLLPTGVPGASVQQQELRDVRASTPDVAHGAELFRSCAACHGASGQGTLNGQVPRIAAQHVSVLEKQLVDYRHDRRWDLRMESVADRHHLPDAQAIADVATYVSQISEDFPNGKGPGTLLAQGADGYAQLCRGCHGADGQGDEKTATPLIAGQHYEYLRRQVYDAVDGRRPNFPAEHIRLFARLEHDDIVAIADYLSRLEVARVP